MSDNNKGVQKTTSLQAWSKLTEEYFGKKLRIEDRKDREIIYGLLKEYNLPHERFYAFKSGDQIKKEEFLEAIGDLGLPYWISATPKLGIEDLGRVSKLGLENADDGWNFLQSLDRLKDFKVIIMQYPDNIEFKGTVVVSRSLNGIAEFVEGDKHLQLISGQTFTDPMLFNQQKIIRYSDTIEKEHQDELFSLISNRAGHYEFQYGSTPDKPQSIIFFDFNDELAYEDVDALFNDLIVYYEKAEEGINGFDVKGIPASLGKAKGKVKIIMSSDTDSYGTIKEGDVLVSDTTNPDMTPVMKKVSAIITDMGGVTSHAAIVTRELGIPCIVGTRNATQVLKDGMEVEVDAFSGTIRII
ncbi:MAG: PEP-utilizing enzyme [Patescibacteria group bacterium]